MPITTRNDFFSGRFSGPAGGAAEMAPEVPTSLFLPRQRALGASGNVPVITRGQKVQMKNLVSPDKWFEFSLPPFPLPFRFSTIFGISKFWIFVSRDSGPQIVFFSRPGSGFYKQLRARPILRGVNKDKKNTFPWISRARVARIFPTS